MLRVKLKIIFVSNSFVCPSVKVTVCGLRDFDLDEREDLGGKDRLEKLVLDVFVFLQQMKCKMLQKMLQVQNR
jgi:hypothetical protein